ncbi:CyP450 monooxygenase [Hygrophoropsis aurantiaca]|uniref:CyP450 monooxygenase n=1 Tax=Hygrophoropsis aurantiaca TaxID=72124 RepID=A0ACB8ARM9_9AGAM|nr:CyP450 monooxygenase [Hygrophoropsis aurantiaca]
MDLTKVIDALVLLTAILLLKNYLVKRKLNPGGLPLPPGPSRLPIIGNLFGIDLGAQWLTYAAWGKKYGDLLYVEILGTKVLVLNSEEIAKDLLDKRSQNYSDRPQVLMAFLMGWEFNVGFIPYGDYWRKHRKAMHQGLKPEAVMNYRPLQLEKVHQLVRNFIHTPKDIQEHIKFTASTIMMVVYGYEMAPQNDRFASIADRASEMLTNSFFPGAALVNTFPILQYLPEWCPGTGFKQFARECRQLTREMRDAPYEYVKRTMAAGTAPQSMVSEMIQNKEEVTIIKSVAGTTYAAAVETSSSALSAFVLAMIMFPEVQKKAQAEIDMVTSGYRLPEYDDRDSLVYIEAIYRETLRWAQVTPLGVPHVTTESDIYKGYYIPKGTTVFANIWAMTHNESQYPDPMRFMPERFINPDGGLTDDLAQQQFGFGRRICVGRHLADAAVWLAIVNILAVFDLGKAKDEHGRVLEPAAEWTPGVIIHPKPYPFSITPRSTHLAELAQNTSNS